MPRYDLSIAIFDTMRYIMPSLEYVNAEYVNKRLLNAVFHLSIDVNEVKKGCEVKHKNSEQFIFLLCNLLTHR